MNIIIIVFVMFVFFSFIYNELQFYKFFNSKAKQGTVLEVKFEDSIREKRSFFSRSHMRYYYNLVIETEIEGKIQKINIIEKYGDILIKPKVEDKIRLKPDKKDSYRQDGTFFTVYMPYPKYVTNYSTKNMRRIILIYFIFVTIVFFMHYNF